MPTSEEIKYAEQLRELLLKARSLPANFYLENGEWFRIFVVDCYGQVIISTPYRRFDADNQDLDTLPVQTSCTKNVRFYLEFFKTVEAGKVLSETVRLHPQFRKYLSKDKSKRLYVLVFDGPGSLPSAMQTARRRVLGRYKRPRKDGPWRSSSTPRPSPETENSSYMWYYSNGGYNPPQLTSGWIPYIQYQRTWTGVRTPNFGARRNGRLPVNPHSVTILTQSHPATYYREYHRTWKFERWRIDKLYYWGSLNWTTAPPHDVLVRDMATKRAIGKGSNAVKGNIALTVAEANKTLAMFSNTASRLTGAVSNLRRGNIAGAIHSLWAGKQARFRKGGGPSVHNSLSQNWLELQYGWKPLLNDIHEGFESLARYNAEQREPYFQLTASAKRKSETVQDLFDSFTKRQKMGALHTHLTFRCKVGFRYKLDDNLVALLAQTGFTNPLNLAWELIPFSFVVDWFLPIGPYLESLRAWDGLQFVDGYRVQFTRQRKFGYMSGTIYDAPNNVDFTAKGSQSSEIIRFDREKLSSFPTLGAPRLRAGLSTHRALNAWALLIQVFGRAR